MKVYRLRQIGIALALFLSVVSVTAVANCQQIAKVTVCQLEKDPPAYNHKLVQVTGFVSHGFEDFTLFDPACPTWLSIWMEYGGTVASGTMYCCGVTNARTRPKELEVEKIPIPLVDDEHFREFDRLLQRKPDAVVHATIVGRFFAGRLVHLQKGTYWGGYGHMGCCSLLAIQQVLSVGPHDRNDLDYRFAPDQPMEGRVGCTYWWLSLLDFKSAIRSQRAADAGKRAWVFDDPRRVAADFLARLLKTDDSSIQGIKRTRKSQGRIIYEWKSPRKKNVTYALVVSRPYWLSFYSRDPRHVAWIVLGAFKSSCGETAR